MEIIRCNALLDGYESDRRGNQQAQKSRLLGVLDFFYFFSVIRISVSAEEGVLDSSKLMETGRHRNYFLSNERDFGSHSDQVNDLFMKFYIQKILLKFIHG